MRIQDPGMALACPLVLCTTRTLIDSACVPVLTMYKDGSA